MSLNKGDNHTGIILLHGLPDFNDSDLFTSFASLRQVLYGLVPSRNVIPYEWFPRDLLQDRTRERQRERVAAFRVIMDHLKKGRLGEAKAYHLANFINTVVSEFSEVRNWILIGYSGGGWILNHLLFLVGRRMILDLVTDKQQDQAAEQLEEIHRNLNQIAAVFTIGAPYQNIHEDCEIGRPTGDPPQRQTIQLDKWNLASFYYDEHPPEIEWDPAREHIGPEILARILRPGRYHSILFSGDTTVWADNASFPPHLVKAGLLRELILGQPRSGQGSVQHDNLCSQNLVTSYIFRTISRMLADP